MISFNEKIKRRSKEINSFLCVGIDISTDSLGSDNLEHLISHSKKVIDATKDIALAYKPNFAFFEKWGSRGFQWLENIMGYIGDGPITIADAKRGDIGNTAKQYAASIFGHFDFDSVTLSPYMGEDSIMPFLTNEEKGVFILCRTSNLSGKTFQSLNLNDEFKIYEKVANWANSLNYNDNVGLVVGATAPEELIKVRRLAPSLPILIPGIGVQGGDLVSCIREGNKSGVGIINISRDISFSGNHSVNDIRQSAKMYVKKMNEALND